MIGPVHFIYLGGRWPWQFTRAVKTARVHGAPIWLHAARSPYTTVYSAEAARTVDAMPNLRLPRWLAKHPIQLANVKDLYAWQLLHEHGGIYLDLDTISLRPAWAFLGDADVCVSTEFPPDERPENPYNSAVVIGRQGAPALAQLAEDAYSILRSGEERWGKTGPHLLTKTVARWDGAIVAAPFGALNGWSYHGIGDYYRHPRDPGEGTSVIHLYSSDHQPEFLEDTWTPLL